MMLNGLLISLYHKYIDEPWKNAKDSLVRAMIKDGSYIADEPGKKE